MENREKRYFLSRLGWGSAWIKRGGNHFADRYCKIVCGRIHTDWGQGIHQSKQRNACIERWGKKCWDKIAEQNKQIENNIKVIADSDITLKEEKANKVTVKADVTEESYPSVAYLENYYYDYNDVDDEIQNLKSSVDTKLNLKADKADTLAGYGITDAYDKTYINRSLNLKLDKMPFDTAPKENSPNYITSGTLYNSVNTLNQSIAKNMIAQILRSVQENYLRLKQFMRAVLEDSIMWKTAM